VPLETLEGDEDEEKQKIQKYRVRPVDFYLPYLSIIESGARKSPRATPKEGYRAIQELAFEPDELAAIGTAAARVQQLGDGLLVEQARSAIRKLAFDVPGIDADGEDGVIVKGERVDVETLAALNGALLSHKRLRFTYHSMSGDTTTRRTVEPFGIFFLNGHWYLAAREPAASAVKNFRVTRMRGVSPNKKQPQTPDFAISPDFNLRDHARSRMVWELGDTDTVDAVVEFTTHTGAASPWMRLGGDVPGHPTRRAFRVRLADRFARWVMSFGGAAKVVSPPELTDELARAVRETLARYEDKA
jgi:predicted DNA-binding transcriptional regulator YafY